MKRRIQDRQPTEEKGMSWQRGGSTAGREGVETVEGLQARLAQKDQALHQAKKELTELRQETGGNQEAAAEKSEALNAELEELVQGLAAKETEIEELQKQASSVADKDTEIRELLEIISSNEEEIERLKQQDVGAAVKTAEVTGFKSASEQGDKYLVNFSGPDGDVAITISWKAIRKTYQQLKTFRKAG